MPNSRRRKFSVQNQLRKVTTNNFKTESQSSLQNLLFGKKKIYTRESEDKKNINSHINGHTSTLEIIPESHSLTSVLNLNKTTITADKNTIPTVSNITFYRTPIENKQSKIETIVDTHISKRQIQFESGGSHLEKRPHRIKVRSPKRRGSLISDINKNKRSIGVWTDLERDKTEYIIHNDTEVNKYLLEVERLPETSCTDDMCRICHGGDAASPEFGRMISACACRGTIGRVHVICLETWLTESGKSRCELCSTRYSTRRVHKYGVFKALIMWLLSQNAKQLMVDGLGTVLMSPLAMLAAWLSGRTLVSLMAQEDEMAPWPLASTFVLACTTLVCYYCWIVSAATRHALSWWIWYRSQYEVKLQLEDQ